MIGQIIGGRYEVIRLIGRGGMGAIYEVRNTRVGRAFAMKTLIGEAADDSEVLARFRREADVVARIKHPNIVEVIDWESLEDGSPCIILEYLNGEDLSRRIRDAAPMPWLFIARVGDQILNALSVAHAAGVVHRDLKPQNVFLALDDSRDERAKLLDFGVSKIRDSRSLVTTDARLLGTPSYMSPEQAEGRHEDIGPATDVWAMGAILYEMATGELAFDGPSMPAVLYRICSKDCPSVSVKRPDAPAAFEQLVREMLAREGDHRIADATIARARLREALAEVAPQARYSDQVLAARATPATPIATPVTNPTPRRKRLTGAHDKTVSHEIATANTIQSGAFEKPTPVNGQISASTLPPPKRRLGLALAVGAAALAMVAIAIVVATTRGEPRASEPTAAPRPVQLVEPPAPPADAAIVVVEADAAAPVAVPAVPAKTPVKASVKAIVKKPPKPEAPKPEVTAEPPKPDIKPEPPKRARCEGMDKNSKEYALCINGDGT